MPCRKEKGERKMEEKKVNDDVVIKALVVAKDGFSKLYNGNLYEDALKSGAAKRYK